MAYKVNYNFQKAERDRAKAAKKEAKLREKQAARAGNADTAEPSDGTVQDGDSDAPATSHPE